MQKVVHRVVEKRKMVMAERRTGVHHLSERGLAALGTGGREDSDLVMVVMIKILVVMMVRIVTMGMMVMMVTMVTMVMMVMMVMMVIPVLLRATGGERSKARHEEVKPVENDFTGLFKGLPGSSNHMN